MLSNVNHFIVYLECVPYLKEVRNYWDEALVCNEEKLLQEISYYTYPWHELITDPEVIGQLDETALLVPCVSEDWEDSTPATILSDETLSDDWTGTTLQSIPAWAAYAVVQITTGAMRYKVNWGTPAADDWFFASAHDHIILELPVEINNFAIVADDGAATIYVTYYDKKPKP